MKKMLIGLIAALGCAGMGQSAHARSADVERWQGFLLRNGLQVPVTVELAGDRAGLFRVGSSSRPLENVSVKGLDVHFELPGEGAFDGTVAGDRMAGSVSGASAAGSFALTREPDQPFADPITSTGP